MGFECDLGTLALVNLFLEGEVELRTLQSVCNLCPELNKLLLLETAIRATDHHTTDHPIQTEIKNYFSQLKKVTIEAKPKITLRIE